MEVRVKGRAKGKGGKRLEKEKGRRKEWRKEEYERTQEGALRERKGGGNGAKGEE